MGDPQPHEGEACLSLHQQGTDSQSREPLPDPAHAGNPATLTTVAPRKQGEEDYVMVGGVTAVQVAPPSVERTIML